MLLPKITIFFFIFLVLTNHTHANLDPAIQTRLEDVETVQLLGNWLQQFNEKCGHHDNITSLNCDPKPNISSHEAESVQSVQDFGNWLQSCSVSIIGEISESKFRGCMEINNYLRH